MQDRMERARGVNSMYLLVGKPSRRKPLVSRPLFGSGKMVYFKELVFRS